MSGWKPKEYPRLIQEWFEKEYLIEPIVPYQKSTLGVNQEWLWAQRIFKLYFATLVYLVELISLLLNESN